MPPARDMSSVGLTAHYTAYAWHLLGAPESDRFVTFKGRLLHAAASPLAAAASALGVGHPVSLLLEPRYRILEHELRRSGCRCFVELGAGLSPRGTAYARDPEVTYVEVDQAGMVRVKARLVGQARGRGQHFLPGDVLDDTLYRRLYGLVNGKGPLVVVAEGLSAYLARPDFERLLANVALFLIRCGGGMFMTDVSPVSAVRRFGWIGSVFTWGIGVVARWPLGLPVASVGDAVDLFRRAGFGTVKVHDPSLHPATADLDHHKFRGVTLVVEGRVEPFDSGRP